MRRSRSLTSIPIPIHMRRDSKNRERAKSTTRNSRDPSLDSQTPLAYRLLSSDRKHTAQKYSLRTPTTPSVYTGFKRSGSLWGSSLGSISKSRSPSEKKSIQKKINDKKWVAEQYVKIQHFIHTSGLFDPQLATSIRPPTINTFIQLVSVLLQRIINTVPINSQNYTDIIVTHLKLLRYPGSITVSTIKTANTMHGWPQFIAIVSWLIQQVDTVSVENAFRDQQDEELIKKFRLQDTLYEFINEQYNIFTENKDSDGQNRYLESEEKLHNNISEIVEIDYEAAEQLSHSLESCRADINELDAKIENVMEENLKIQGSNLEKHDAIRNFQENKGKKELELDEQLAQLEKTLSRHNDQKNELVLSVKNIENRLGMQACSAKERTKLLAQIEDLKRGIARKERKLAEYQTFRDDLDRKLQSMVRTIEAKVDRWNILVTKTLKPEMQRLHLREKGFHSPEFLQELREVVRDKQLIEEESLKECKSIKSEINKLQKEKELIMETTIMINATKAEVKELENVTQSLQEKSKELISEIDKATKNHEANIKHLEKVAREELNKEHSEIAAFEDRMQKLSENLDRTSENGIALLTGARNLSIQLLTACDEVRQAMLSNVMAQSIAQSTETKQFLIDLRSRRLND